MLGNDLNGDGRLVGLWRSADGAALDEAGRTSLRNGAAAFAGRMAEWTGRPDTGAVGYTLDAVPEAERGTFDRLLLIRRLHNMVDDGIAESELSRMHALLKPGGMLGVVQHRAKADAPDDYADGSKGYLRQADVVALVEGQGFELVGKSEINANLQDTADHQGQQAVTTIEEPTQWYPAEDYHQEYWDGEGQRNPYCLAVIPPKLMKLRKSFAAKVKG